MAMQRKKGTYDLVYYKTKNEPEAIVSGVDWNKIKERLATDYKEFINVKDENYISEPYFMVVTNQPEDVKEKDREAYYYTKRK